MTDSPKAGSATVRRVAGLIEAQMGDELLGLHVPDGTCYGFNETAARIWSLTRQPIGRDALCDRLAAEFDVESAQCRGEVDALLDDLVRDGLIEIAA